MCNSQWGLKREKMNRTLYSYFFLRENRTLQKCLYYNTTTQYVGIIFNIHFNSSHFRAG